MRKGLGIHDRHSPFRFNPETLFLGGTVQGAFYDPSDLTTLFQDSAGTTPVTAVGQAVGLMLDKSKGRALGSELVSNGTFDSNINGWTAQFTSTASWQAGALRSISSGTNAGEASTPITCVVGRTYRVTGSVLGGTSSGRITASSTAFGGSGGSYVASGTQTFYFVATATTMYVVCGNGGAANGVYCDYDNISVRELAGNHATSSGTSRPLLQQTDGLYHLTFDGSNDSMATSAIDFTGTNKMTVWTGLRKSSDAAQGVVAELSATIASNNGAFLLSAPNSAAANYNWSSKGTTQVDNTVTTYTAPNTAVLTGQADIAAPSNIIRVNGAQAGSVATTQGTGNFGNYPLYIGRRNNATLPFNGRLYGLIVLGAAASTWQINVTEQWMAGKTGITI